MWSRWVSSPQLLDFSTRIIRPFHSVSSRALIAASASSSVSSVKNPNPRESPDLRRNKFATKIKTQLKEDSNKYVSQGKRMHKVIAKQSRCFTDRERITYPCQPPQYMQVYCKLHNYLWSLTIRTCCTLPYLENFLSRSLSVVAKLKPATNKFLPGFPNPVFLLGGGDQGLLLGDRWWYSGKGDLRLGECLSLIRIKG